MQPGVGAQESLLGGVFRFGHIAEHTVGQREDRPLIGLHQQAKSCLLAGSGAFQPVLFLFIHSQSPLYAYCLYAPSDVKFREALVCLANCPRYIMNPIHGAASCHRPD